MDVARLKDLFTSRDGRAEPVRYAVVGLGHIAQAAVLPAFEHARNSRLVALVSSDAEKLRELGRRHRVERLHDYGEYERLLASGDVDAVFIALPNHLHEDYTVRAARAGVHVLCEKPMAVHAAECRRMIEAAREHDVRLMIAYRLHFEEANLAAVEVATSGRIGQPRLITSTFSMPVRDGDIRLGPVEEGGGPLYDIGVYCINAARYLFRDEPVEATCATARGEDPRFRESYESCSVTLRFPGDRLASFACSFGAESVSEYRVVGTEGDLAVEPAYSYSQALRHRLTVEGETSETTFDQRDQFAAELLYFSDCVRGAEEPEPSGAEGLVDVAIIEACHESARTGRPVALDLQRRGRRPDMDQEIHRPPVRREPKLVNTDSPKE